MNKKWLPHIVAVWAFAVFIVLGLACASSADVNSAASIDDVEGIDNKLQWLKSNAVSGGNYTLEVSGNERIFTGGYTNNANLSFKDKNNITITLRGKAGLDNVIFPSHAQGLFTVGSGVTLVLDSNITLWGAEYVPLGMLGAPQRYYALVIVLSGGTLVMNDGSNIFGNTNNTSDGGGVSVSNGGTFIMNGGTISGNTCFRVPDAALSASSDGKYNTFSDEPYKGGGVYVANNGTFTKTGGTISGYTSRSDLFKLEGQPTPEVRARVANVVRGFNAGDPISGYGHAVFANGKRKETTAGPEVNLHYSKGESSGAWDN